MGPERRKAPRAKREATDAGNVGGARGALAMRVAGSDYGLRAVWRRVVREREGGEPDQAAADRVARAIVFIAHLLSLCPEQRRLGRNPETGAILACRGARRQPPPEALFRRRLAVPWSALIPDADYRRCVIDVAQMRLTAVQVPDADPWLRRSGIPRAGDESPLRGTRALGTGD